MSLISNDVCGTDTNITAKHFTLSLTNIASLRPECKSTPLHIAQTLIEHRSDFRAKKKFHFEVENDTDVDYGPLPIVVAVLLASCG